MPVPFKRKRNRIPQHSIYQGGHWYFITICTDPKQNIFVAEGLSLHNNRFLLNPFGKSIEHAWLNLPNIFNDIILDEYVVMPNHFHGVVGFEGTPVQKNTNKAVDLGAIISRFKNDARRSVIGVVESNEIDGKTLMAEQVAGQARRYGGQTDPVVQFNPYSFWQKSFYDHIIQDEHDLMRIREYIKDNPMQWQLDEYFHD